MLFKPAHSASVSCLSSLSCGTAQGTFLYCSAFPVVKACEDNVVSTVIVLFINTLYFLFMEFSSEWGKNRQRVEKRKVSFLLFRVCSKMKTIKGVSNLT